MRDTSWLNAEAHILRPTSVWWNSATSSSITTTTEKIVKTANPVSAIVTPPASKPRSPKGAGKDRKPASKIAVSEAALGDLCGLDGVETDGVAETVGVPGDCLLYTSPSPRDRTRSRMPSSA